MFGCESWTIKKAEHWRIDAFELWFSKHYISWKEREETLAWLFLGFGEVTEKDDVDEGEETKPMQESPGHEGRGQEDSGCPSSELYKKHISPPIGFAFKNVEDKICWFVSTFFLLSGSWFVSNIGRLLGNSASIDLDTWVELLTDSTESGTQYPQHQAVSVKIWKLHQKGHDDLI